MKIFIPDFTDATKIYFPLGHVESDVYVARREKDGMLRDILNNSKVDFDDVPEFVDEDDILDNVVPPYVQTTGEIQSYLDSIKNAKDD